MVVLKSNWQRFRMVAFVLVTGLLSTGCVFDPELVNLGYTSCSNDSPCPSGMVCVEGFCVPDCQSLEEKVSIEPDESDTGRWWCSNNDYCNLVGQSDSQEIAYLDVKLIPGTYLFLGPGETTVDCERILVRFSVLSKESASGKSLRIVIHSGEELIGVVDDSIVLGTAEQDFNHDNFRKNTYFLALSGEKFPNPTFKFYTNDQGAVFAVREFVMSCCELPK
jgi:hypothetical protein